MNRTLYEKRGRRYVAVAEEETWDALAEGAWLVVVKPGSRSQRRLLKPERAEVEVALNEARVAMVEAMRARTLAANDLPMRTSKLTPAEKRQMKRAWEAWVAIAGDVPIHFRGVSWVDVVECGIAALRTKMETP